MIFNDSGNVVIKCVGLLEYTGLEYKLKKEMHNLIAKVCFQSESEREDDIAFHFINSKRLIICTVEGSMSSNIRCIKMNVAGFKPDNYRLFAENITSTNDINFTIRGLIHDR